MGVVRVSRTVAMCPVAFFLAFSRQEERKKKKEEKEAKEAKKRAKKEETEV